MFIAWFTIFFIVIYAIFDSDSDLILFDSDLRYFW